MKNIFTFNRVVSFFAAISYIVSLVSPALASNVMELSEKSQDALPQLIGLKIHPEDPLLFDFIVDRGPTSISPSQLNEETQKLVKYFLTALTIPDQEVWVNLSPEEKDRILPEALGHTVMGQVMLEQDLQLKQLASSLTNPQMELGQKYWDQMAACSPQNSNTLNRVWILPEKAEVWEHDGMVIVGQAKLKVMMDDHKGSSEPFKAVILPRMNEMVNAHPHFALVRQMYQAVILAAWYKQALKESLLGKVYTDQNKISGVQIKDKDFKEQIYQQYLTAIKKGAYQLIVEREDIATGEEVPQKYFSGGVQFGRSASSALERKAVSRFAMTSLVARVPASQLMDYEIRLAENKEEMNVVTAGSSLETRYAGKNVVSLDLKLKTQEAAQQICDTLQRQDLGFETWWRTHQKLARAIYRKFIEILTMEEKKGIVLDRKHPRSFTEDVANEIILYLAKENYWGEDLNPDQHPEMAFPGVLKSKVFNEFNKALAHLKLGKIYLGFETSQRFPLAISADAWRMLVNAVEDINHPQVNHNSMDVRIHPQVANIVRALVIKSLENFREKINARFLKELSVQIEDYQEVKDRFMLSDEDLMRYLALLGFKESAEGLNAPMTLLGFQTQAILYQNNVDEILTMVIIELQKVFQTKASVDVNSIRQLTQRIEDKFDTGALPLDRELLDQEARQMVFQTIHFLGVVVGEFDQIQLDQTFEQFDTSLVSRRIVVASTAASGSQTAQVIEFGPALQKRKLVRSLLARLRSEDIRARSVTNPEAVTTWWQDSEHQRLSEVFLQKIFDGMLVARQNPNELLLKYNKIPFEVIRSAVLSMIMEGHIPDPLSAAFQSSLGEKEKQSHQLKLSVPRVDDLMSHLGLGYIQVPQGDYSWNIIEMVPSSADQMYRALNQWQPILVTQERFSEEFKMQVERLRGVLLAEALTRKFDQTSDVFVLSRDQLQLIAMRLDIHIDQVKLLLRLFGFKTSDQQSFEIRRTQFQKIDENYLKTGELFSVMAKIIQETLSYFELSPSQENLYLRSGYAEHEMVEAILDFLGFQSISSGRYRYAKGYQIFEKELYSKKILVPSASSSVGGIAFDMSQVKLQIKRDARGVPLPLPQQNVQAIKLEGLYPVILRATPFNLQLLSR